MDSNCVAFASFYVSILVSIRVALLGPYKADSQFAKQLFQADDALLRDLTLLIEVALHAID